MRKKILELRKSGLSLDEIAIIVKRSKSTVNYHCNEKLRKMSNFRRLKNRKSGLIELKKEYGGKCNICKYSRCLEALEFHHKDPKNKLKFFKSMGDLIDSHSLKLAKIEAKKCILICANCHRELHAGIINL